MNARTKATLVAVLVTLGLAVVVGTTDGVLEAGLTRGQGQWVSFQDTGGPLDRRERDRVQHGIGAGLRHGKIRLQSVPPMMVDGRSLVPLLGGWMHRRAKPRQPKSLF